MTFVSGVACGFFLGLGCWAFITGLKGLVGDDDTNEFGRVER